MQVTQANRSEFIVNALPDGSKVILDSNNDKVIALNATAGAAWDACEGTTTLTEVTARMRQTLGPAVSEAMAEEAVLRLEAQNLVLTSDGPVGASRRQVLATLGAIAVPLVVSMTMSDQRAYAMNAGSGQVEERHHHQHDHGDDHISYDHPAGGRGEDKRSHN
ncbi:MAG: PqqD family protein [Terracidiphilus sp.]